VEAALARLKSEHLLDDRRFAASFARSRLGGTGHGRLRIRSELRRRGVEREPIEAGLAEALDDFPEAEAIDVLIRRLARQASEQTPERRLRRIWMALLRRGFPPSLVRRRLEVLKPAWRDMLDGPMFDAPVEDPDTGSGGRRDEGD